VKTSAAVEVLIFLNNVRFIYPVSKKKHSPIRGLHEPLGCQEVEAPRFQDNRHMKVVVLSTLGTGRFYSPGNISGTHFC
jgi:hypothetical protein